MQPLCNRSPADALAATLQHDNEQTKLGLSRAARKVADHAAKLRPKAILKDARSLKDIAGVASTVHGWEASQKSGTNVFSNQTVVISDETVTELRQRLARLRGEVE